MLTALLMRFDAWRTGMRKGTKESDATAACTVTAGLGVDRFINTDACLLPTALCEHQRDALALRRLQSGFNTSFVGTCPCSATDTSKTARTVADQLPTAAWVEFVDTINPYEA